MYYKHTALHITPGFWIACIRRWHRFRNNLCRWISVALQQYRHWTFCEAKQTSVESINNELMNMCVRHWTITGAHCALHTMYTRPSVRMTTKHWLRSILVQFSSQCPKTGYCALDCRFYLQLSGEKFSNEMSMLSSNCDSCDSSPENYFILASKLQTITISHYSTAIVFGCWSETNGCVMNIYNRENCAAKKTNNTQKALHR